MNGSFELAFRNFADNTIADAGEIIKKSAVSLLVAVVDRSPVGNPKLWAANAHAAQYNNEVDIENARLRADPANLNKAGRLKPGRKIKDSMPLVSGAGYVGGRFRGNWQVAFEVAPTGETGVKDKSGIPTKQAGTAVIDGFHSSVGSIWLMNNTAYSIPLEYGHSKMQAPAGMVRVSVAEFQQFVNKAAGELSD